MTLRLKLTFLTTIILLATSTVLGIAVSTTMSTMQYESIDDNLSATVAIQRVKSLILKPRPLPTDVFNTVAVVLIDPKGQQVTLRPAGYGTDPLTLPNLDAETVNAALQGAITVSGEPSYRVIARAQNGHGQTVAVLTPLDAVDAQLTRLNRSVAVSVAGITAVGGLLAWFLIGRTLRPVRDMVEAAQAIASGDLGRRVPDVRPTTEMGDLALALNEMITALTTSLDDVRASEERLRTFVSDASHELRTPLTVIRGYREVLEGTMPEATEVQARALARIAAESDRLERLVTELLALQRASASFQSEATADLSVVFREAFESFAELHPDRVVEIDTEAVEVPGGTDSWAQVAGNLAQNIHRYTPAGSSVRVAVRDDDGRCVVTIDDEGPGVPAERRAQMLERFTRLDDARSVDTGGAGLGLSIVRAIVQASGGEVMLAESPRGGLRVVIDVPLVH